MVEVELEERTSGVARERRRVVEDRGWSREALTRQQHATIALKFNFQGLN